MSNSRNRESRVDYEWCVEVEDERGDIIDVFHFDSYIAAARHTLGEEPLEGCKSSIVLVKTAEEDRSWAYVGTLGMPGRFESGDQVPVRYIREVAKHLEALADHASITRHQGDQAYRNRGYITSRLDDRHFEELLHGGFDLDLNGYCLDALDQIPAGCMNSHSGRPVQTLVTRGITLREQLAIDEMIADILASS